jgi:DNA primase
MRRDRGYRTGATMGTGDDLAEAKRRLPLPTLLDRLGLGVHAKKSALCPFHDDRRSSFSVWNSAGRWLWKCHAGCGQGDEITFLEKFKSISNREAIKLFKEMAGL